jgi:uncharacterized protein (DUF433 family)
MRLTVRRVVEAVAVFPDREKLRCEHPKLEDGRIRQALEYATTAKVAQERHKTRPDPSPGQVKT